MILKRGVFLFTADSIKKDLASSRRKKVILDSDAFNEIDDQYAIVHLLTSPGQCDLLGMCATPYLNDRSVSAADGERKSYDEIVKLLSLTCENTELPVLHGSANFLSDRYTPEPSEAADWMIQTVKKYPEEPVYIVALGAITNVASAFLKAPEIRENTVVIWLGANLPEVGKNIDEFNLREDISAGQVLFDSGAVIVLLPMAVTANVYIAQTEMKDFLQRSSLPVCSYLHEEWCGYMGEEAHGKVIWDLAGSGAAAVPGCCRFEILPTPALGDDSEYVRRETENQMLMLREIDAPRIFSDLFGKMEQAVRRYSK